MIEIDISKVNQTVYSLEDCSKRMWRLNNEVNDISNYIKLNFTMDDIYHKLQKQIENLDEEMKVLHRMNQCLLEVLPIYSGKEEQVLSYLEELQVINRNERIGTLEIPDWIFQMIR